MTIKTILTPIDGREASKSVLDLAFLTAKEFSAHIKGLHVKVDAREAIPLLGEGMSGGMVEEMIDMAENEATARAEAAAKMFAGACAAQGVEMLASPKPVTGPSASWQEAEGREEDIICREAPLNDLVIVRRPGAGSSSDATAQMVLNTVLFETGRPALIAPEKTPATIGRNIAIAWNGSVEATRTIQSAMTFIPGAEKVTIITAESDRTETDEAEKLAEYFLWHGVTVAVEAINQTGGSVGELVLAKADDVGADLLIMGAYTHGRMRQLILGGVTSHVIGHANIPVYMAH